MKIFKISQNKSKLEELWKVNPAFSSQIEKDISSLEKSQKSKILNYIKEHPISSQQDFDIYQNQLNQQLQFSKNIQSLQIPQELLNKINQTTQSKDYRKWLISQANNPSLEEDLPKIKQQLQQFDKIKPQLSSQEQNIFNLQNSSDLYSLISKYSKSNETPNKINSSVDGLIYLAKDLQITGKKIDLLELSTQDALDQIAKINPTPPNWCVLRGTKYSPHRYFCVLVNNSPEILIHPESQQIKDSADKPISSLLLTQIAVSLIQQFPQLNSAKTSNNQDYIPQSTSDYSLLFKNYEKIQLLQKAEQENNQTELSYFIENNPENISLLQEQNKTKYLHLIHPYDINLDTFNHNDLILYAHYLKINSPKTNDPRNPSNLDRMEGLIFDWLDDKDNFVRYHSKIPDELKSSTVSKQFSAVKTRKIQEILSSIQNKQPLANWQDELISNLISSNDIENLPQKTKLIELINQSMENTGLPPKFGYKYVENILNTNPPPSWTEKIMEKFITRNPKYHIPFFAESWANSQLENPSSTYYLTLFHYAPEWNTDWAENKLKDPNFTPPSQWIESILNENYIPIWADNYIESQFKSDNPNPQILDSILNHSQNEIPNFAEDFFISQLKKPNPHPKVIEHISRMLWRNGSADEISEDWIASNLASPHPHPTLTKYILRYYEEEETVPDIAADWLENYLNTNNSNKIQASINWLHFIK